MAVLHWVASGCIGFHWVALSCVGLCRSTVPRRREFFHSLSHWLVRICQQNSLPGSPRSGKLPSPPGGKQAISSLPARGTGESKQFADANDRQIARDLQAIRGGKSRFSSLPRTLLHPRAASFQRLNLTQFDRLPLQRLTIRPDAKLILSRPHCRPQIGHIMAFDHSQR